MTGNLGESRWCRSRKLCLWSAPNMALERLKAAWRTVQEKRLALVEEYGLIAVGTLFALSLPIYAFFFWVRWRDGSLDGTRGIGTTFVLAWAATRASLPLRIAGALVLTPLVAKVVRRNRKPAPPTP
jgi:hypothetical protein